MAGMTFSDRWVARRRGMPGQLYWLRPARLILLAVGAAILAFGIAFAVGLATKTSSHTVKLSPAAAAATHSSSAVKISANAPAISIPAMAKAPVHHVAHKTPVVVVPIKPVVKVRHTASTPVYTPPPVTHTTTPIVHVPTPTVPTPTVPTRTQTPPSGGTTTGTGTVTGGG
jgi:hypothetical protein